MGKYDVEFNGTWINALNLSMWQFNSAVYSSGSIPDRWTLTDANDELITPRGDEGGETLTINYANAYFRILLAGTRCRPLTYPMPSPPPPSILLLSFPHLPRPLPFSEYSAPSVLMSLAVFGEANEAYMCQRIILPRLLLAILDSSSCDRESRETFNLTGVTYNPYIPWHTWPPPLFLSFYNKEVICTIFWQKNLSFCLDLFLSAGRAEGVEGRLNYLGRT